MLPPVSLRTTVPVGQEFRNEPEQGVRTLVASSKEYLWLDLVQRLANGRGSAHARKNRQKRPRRKPNASFNHRPHLNARIWWSPTMKKAGPKVLIFTTFDSFGGNGPTLSLSAEPHPVTSIPSHAKAACAGDPGDLLQQRRGRRSIGRA